MDPLLLEKTPVKFVESCDAQEYFSQARNQVCLEINYAPLEGYSVQEKPPAYIANSSCFSYSTYWNPGNSKFAEQIIPRYFYTLLTEDGTHQAGVGSVIVKDNGGLLGSVPVLIKQYDKFILPRRMDSLNLNPFMRCQDSASGISLDSFASSIQKYVEEASVDKSIHVWSANGWVKIIRVLRYPIQVPSDIYRIVCTRGVLEGDFQRQKFILRSNDIISMHEMTTEEQPRLLLFRIPDNRIGHKNSQTYDIAEEQKRAFYAKF